MFYSKLGQGCKCLVGQGILRSLRLCAMQMGEFLGTFSFVVLWMIKSHNLWIRLWFWSIPQRCGVLVLTIFVGSQPAFEVSGEWVLSFYFPFYWHIFPLENGVAIEGSSSGSFFLLDCGFRQDSNYRQPSEEAFCCPWVVFYVQRVWGICRSSPPSLSYSLWDVEYDLLLVWDLLGDASKGSRLVGLLDMQFQASS